MKWYKEGQTVPEIIDSYRLIPRLLVAGYGVMCGIVAMWFMGLDSPNGSQAAFVSTIIGASAGWFGFYVKSGNNTE